MNVMFYQIHRPLKPWRGAWPAGASRRAGTRMTRAPRRAEAVYLSRMTPVKRSTLWGSQEIYRLMVTYGHLYHENGHETGYTLILEQIESQTQDKPLLEMLTASGSSAAPAEPHRFWLQRELAADGPMTTFCRCVRPKEKCSRSLSWRSVDIMSCKQQNHIYIYII